MRSDSTRLEVGEARRRKRHRRRRRAASCTGVRRAAVGMVGEEDARRRRRPRCCRADSRGRRPARSARRAAAPAPSCGPRGGAPPPNRRRTPAATRASTRTRATRARSRRGRRVQRVAECADARGVHAHVALAVTRLGAHVDAAPAGRIGPDADDDVVLEAEERARRDGLQLARRGSRRVMRQRRHAGRHRLDRREGAAGGRQASIGARSAQHARCCVGERRRVRQVAAGVGAARVAACLKAGGSAGSVVKSLIIGTPAPGSRCHDEHERRDRRGQHAAAPEAAAADRADDAERSSRRARAARRARR